MQTNENQIFKRKTNAMKKIIQKLLLCMLLFFSVVITSTSQERNITGTVKDNNGAPVANASILLKGTNVGTKTDATGLFKIEVTGAKPVLSISSINFITQQVPVGAGNNLEIALLPGETGLQ